MSDGKWYPPQLEPRLALTAPSSGPVVPLGSYPSDRPTAGNQVYAPGLGQPSYVPTVLVSLFFGLFGLIPALRHSRMARERACPDRGYWWAFGSIMAGEVLIIVLPFVFLVGFSTHGGSWSAGQKIDLVVCERYLGHPGPG
ncbi:MAG: hypothetical protein ACYDEY_16665 [Acidimicrobiales bacterium]